jgi:hypothetical protein
LLAILGNIAVLAIFAFIGVLMGLGFH